MSTGLYLRRFARHLPPHRGVALLRPSERGPFRTMYAIEDAAEVAADAIRRVQPEGPYTVGGFCQGGIVAFAVAGLLEEEGQTVRLVLFDTPAPPLPPSVRSVHSAVQSKAAREPRGMRAVVNTLRAAVRHGVRMVLRWLRPWVDRVWHFAALRHLVMLSSPRIYSFYRPRGNRADLLHFFAAEEADWKRQRRQNWRAYTAGTSTTVPVPGDHETIFAERNLLRMAEDLEHWLRTRSGARRPSAEGCDALLSERLLWRAVGQIL